MPDLSLQEIVELLRKALKMENQDRVIIVAKDDEQATVALENGTLALIPDVTCIDGPNFIIYLADPEGENV